MNFFRALYFLPSVAAVVGTALIWRWLYTPTTGFVSYTITQVTSFLGVPDPKIEWLSDPSVVLVSVVLLAAWQVVGYNTVLFWRGCKVSPRAFLRPRKSTGPTLATLSQRHLADARADDVFRPHHDDGDGLASLQRTLRAVSPRGRFPKARRRSCITSTRFGFNQFNFGYASALAWVLFVIIFGFTSCSSG